MKTRFERNLIIFQLMSYSEKVGGIASEEVVLQLSNSKCMHVLLYGLEACPALKSDLRSVNFVIIRFL